MSDQTSKDGNPTVNEAEKTPSQNDAMGACSSKNRILQNPSNEGKIFTRIQHRRYICGACGKEKLEQNLNKHHEKNHADVPFTIDMYELCEIDDRIQCLICNADKFEHDFEKHINDCHPEIFNENKSSNVVWQIKPTRSYSHNDYLEINYQQTMYGNHAPENDVFEIIQHQKKNLCDDCAKELQTPIGYRKVCISDSEFIRLLSHNRIYHDNGQLYLKDSK